MLGVLIGTLTRRAAASLSLLSLAFAAAIPAQGANASGKCSTDSAVQVCVISAALTGGPYSRSPDQRNVMVSVTLKITNTTDYPIDLAFSSRGWSLTPQNAEAIISQGATSVTGLTACDSIERCSFATLSPGASSVAQVRYDSDISSSGLPLIEVASTAAFTGTLIVVERGKPRLVSLALDEFTFGNALSNARR